MLLLSEAVARKPGAKAKTSLCNLPRCSSRRHPSRPFRFVWVGWEGDAEDRRQLKHDMNQAGVADSFLWTGEVANPLDYFACFDAFALVSREDPFPLVCLEAALLEKPILCFAGAGGTPELVEEDSGFVMSLSGLERDGGQVASIRRK